MNRGDLEHVLRMVLNDNRGQVLTEALILGIEASIFHYLKAIQPQLEANNEIRNG